MGEQKFEKKKKQICAGLLAHVDAGKTTLSEALLYESGQLRRLGRVDHRDAFLDTDAQERERGITIFSKQAHLSLDGLDLTLLDTPGHVDFSSEMERTLQVLDYAILVISGTDGVQGAYRHPVAAAVPLPHPNLPVRQQDGSGGYRPGRAAGAAPQPAQRRLCGLLRPGLGGERRPVRRRHFGKIPGGGDSG